MKESDFTKTLAQCEPKQLDMSYWTFEVQPVRDASEMIRPVHISAYMSRKVLPERFYKVIRF